MYFRRAIAPALVSAIAILALSPQAAKADDNGVVYAGGSVGEGVNGFAGGVIALPGARLGEGFALRGGAVGGRYQYETNGARIKAHYVGAEVAVVYQVSGEWGWANFSAGPRVTDTSLKPGDPGNRLAGTRFDVALQTDGAIGDRLRATWFASYGIDGRSYVTQARVGPLVDGETDTRLGLEGGIQGDRAYTRRAAGAFVSTRFSGNWIATVSGGFSKQKAQSAKPYAGLSFSNVF